MAAENQSTKYQHEGFVQGIFSITSLRHPVVDRMKDKLHPSTYMGVV
jgi:hypothetical protein